MSLKTDNPREYTCWKHMMQRCFQPSNPKFGRYGGRGVVVCDRWKSFDNFFKDMGPMPYGQSIDRIDNDGDYTPQNCRWATPSQQSNNVGRNVWIEYNGLRMTASQWSRRVDLSTQCIQYRYHAGWSAQCTLGFTNHLRVSCPNC